VCTSRSFRLPEWTKPAMRRGERLRAVERAVAALAIAVCLLTPGFAQGGFPLPGWLESFPGSTPVTSSRDSAVESSYTVDAQPAEVVAHYRKLFEAQGLTFQPNPDGMGTSIRVEAKECNLLILIRSSQDGTFTKVDCEAKTDASPAVSSGPAGFKVDVIAGHGPKQGSSDWANRVRQHEQEMPPLKLNRDHHDVEAAPLVWPDWLTHVRGAPLTPKSGVDPAKYEFMTARYTTNVPMTEIFDFYRGLLLAHGYRPKAEIATGHTQSGIQQNALGQVEGFNYPDGFPGAYTVVEVSMDRTVLNGPITVSLRFSTHGYKAGHGN